MAYNAPTVRTTGTLITAAIWNADLVANLIAIYAGAMSIASQAAGDILYAASATQLGRLHGTGLLQVNGSSAPTVVSPAVSLLYANSGTSTNVGANNLDAYTLPALTAADKLIVHVRVQNPTRNITDLQLYDATDGVEMADLSNTGTIVTAGVTVSAVATVSLEPDTTTDIGTDVIAWRRTVGGGVGGGTSEASSSSVACAAGWTGGGMSLALRSTGLSLASPTYWYWEIYLLKGE